MILAPVSSTTDRAADVSIKFPSKTLLLPRMVEPSIRNSPGDLTIQMEEEGVVAANKQPLANSAINGFNI